MKNSNLIITVLISLAAGYFAYPYFNKTNGIPVSQSTADIRSESEASLSRPTAKNTSRKPEKKFPAKPSESTETASDLIGTTVDKVESSLPNENAETNYDDKKDSSANNVSSFVGQSPTSVTKRDFSDYKLGTYPLSLEVSSSDPRLLLIRGTYSGFFEDNTVELRVFKERSSLDFSNNKELSYAAKNEDFFTNVNDDGNRLLIRNGENKIFVDISRWPLIELQLGLNTKIYLR
jgi:hypothetical protein